MPIPVSVNSGSASAARRKFPDEGSRLVYRSDGGGVPIIGKAGGTVKVYTDAAGTILADVLFSNGNPATSFIVDKNSLLPDFFGPPDQTDTLYASVDNGVPFKIFSNYDERLDNIFIDNTAKITTQIAAQAVIDSATFTARQDGFLPPSRHLWMIGDSITDNGNPGGAGGSGRVNGLSTFTGQSIIGQALLNLGGQVRYGGVAATGGFTAAQILATHVPTVVANAKRGDICIVLAGTNDQSVTPMATLQSTMRTIFSTLVAAGIRPVVCSIPPGGSPAGSVAYSQSYGAWLKEYALANGWPFVDLYGTIIDPSTNIYLPAYDSGDHVHPNAAGAAAAGAAIAAVLAAHLPITTPALVATNAVPGNLTQPTNAVNLTGGSASTAPTGFFFLVTPGTAGAATLVDANYVGKKVVITRGSTDDALLRATTFTLVAGHRMLVGFKMKGTPAAGGAWHVRLEGAQGTLVGYQGVTTTTGLTTVMFDFVVPAALSNYSYSMDFYATGGAGTTLEFGQITVRDLTAEYGAA